MELWLRRGLLAEVHAQAAQAAQTPERRHGPREGPRCRVGRPGGRQVALPPESALGSPDPSERADLLDRALGGLSDLGRCRAWVTRPGALQVGDVEVAWLAAARHALARHGLEAPEFFVVGAEGWLDLVSGRAQRRRRARVPSPGLAGVRRAHPWAAADEGGEFIGPGADGPWAGP